MLQYNVMDQPRRENVMDISLDTHIFEDPTRSVYFPEFRDVSDNFRDFHEKSRKITETKWFVWKLQNVALWGYTHHDFCTILYYNAIVLSLKRKHSGYIPQT